MTILEFSLLTGLGSLLAGFLGALTGLGGGVVIVPLLTLGFGVDVRYAVGASLVSVIATSSGAAAAYVREGFSNIRAGMFLEIATTIGALFGAAMACCVSPSLIAIIFGLMLAYSAFQSALPRRDHTTDYRPSRLAGILRLDSSYPTPEGVKFYHVHRILGGFALMILAGVLSGLLGIGSGAMKVLAMDQVMRLPFKVSTTTSNFMIGVTAAAGAGVYLHKGYIDPGLAMPVMLGVLVGATLGARVLARAPARGLRLVFGAVILVLAVEMLYNGLSGRI
jgi:uncharacterized membrane protein YfcA